MVAGTAADRACSSARLFEKIKHKNVGIMLDTGHLMNTNPELQTEEDGIEYILKQ